MIVLLSAWPLLVRAVKARGQSLIIDWADTPTLTYHMRTDHWQQWWAGQWVGGTNFYRPITSSIWAILYKTYGMNGLMQFDMMQAFSYIIGTVLLWVYIRALFGRRVAMATLVFFAVSAVEPLGLPNIHYGVHSWIDTPEQWLLIGTIGSGLAFVIAYRQNSALAYTISLVLLAIAIGIKEAAYVTPAVLLWALWASDDLAGNWKKTLPHFAVTLVLLVYRLVIFHGHGMTYGSNRTWLVRFVTNAFGGQPLVELIQGSLDSVVVFAFLIFCGCSIALLFYRRARLAWTTLGIAAIFGALICMDSRQLEVGIVTCAARFLFPDKGTWFPALVQSAIPTIVVFGIWYLIGASHDKAVWKAIVLVVILYSPLLITASWLHVLYCDAAAWALVLALLANHYATPILRPLPHASAV